MDISDGYCQRYLYWQFWHCKQWTSMHRGNSCGFDYWSYWSANIAKDDHINNFCITSLSKVIFLNILDWSLLSLTFYKEESKMNTLDMWHLEWQRPERALFVWCRGPAVENIGYLRIRIKDYLFRQKKIRFKK